MRLSDEPPKAHAAVLRERLTKSWTCSACGKAIAKHAWATIHVVQNVPVNRVYHSRCTPQGLGS